MSSLSQCAGSACVGTGDSELDAVKSLARGLRNRRKALAMEKVIKAFDEAVDPKNLTEQEYIDFTGELIGDLQVRLEAAVAEAREGAIGTR